MYRLALLSLLTRPMNFCCPEGNCGSPFWLDLWLCRYEGQSRFQCGSPHVGHGDGGTSEGFVDEDFENELGWYVGQSRFQCGPPHAGHGNGGTAECFVDEDFENEFCRCTA